MANASEFFGSLGKSISRTADRVVKKTDEFVAVQKIRNQINGLEQQIDRDFREIGEIIFSQNKKGEYFSAEIDKICREISSLKSEVAACKEEIAARKGERICWACGASIPKDARFCMQCGKAAEEETNTESKDVDNAEPVFSDIPEEVKEDEQ